MEQSELGRDWLSKLLDALGYPCPVNIADEVNAPRCGCSLVIDRDRLRPHQIQALIGTDGANIDAMQHMANTCLNTYAGNDSGFFYVVELNGYRQERQAALEKIATEAIAHVTETQKDYEIKNLTAAERRQVHVFFEDYPHLETFSEGKEPNRHLVVRLIQTPTSPEATIENQIGEAE